MCTVNNAKVTVTAPQPSPAMANGRARVLVLDDDPALRELFSAMLDRAGFQATLCGSSAQAIEAYRAAGTQTPAFDCALIDLHIDEKINGVDVGRILREINPLVRLILVSGSVNVEELELHKTQGFDAVLPKPFSIKQLRDTLLAPS